MSFLEIWDPWFQVYNLPFQLFQGIIGFINGSKGLDSSGLSSSAAVSWCFLFQLLMRWLYSSILGNQEMLGLWNMVKYITSSFLVVEPAFLFFIFDFCVVLIAFQNFLIQESKCLAFFIFFFLVKLGHRIQEDKMGKLISPGFQKVNWCCIRCYFPLHVHVQSCLLF